MKLNSVFLPEKVPIDRKFYLIINLCKGYLRQVHACNYLKRAHTLTVPILFSFLYSKIV